MVTGGYQSDGGYIDTTEVYDSDLGSWVISGAKLPQPMSGLRATNIDGRVLIFGNFILFIRMQKNICIIAGGSGNGNGYGNAILEFKPGDEAIIVTLGHMTQNRDLHAISVVQTQDYSNWCN